MSFVHPMAENLLKVHCANLLLTVWPPPLVPLPKLEDAYTSLLWLIAHAEELQIDSNRIAIIGDSSGGGITTRVAINARNKGIGLAAQILIYPMLNNHVEGPNNWIDTYALLSSQEVHDI